jgi:hypothetical protein
MLIRSLMLLAVFVALPWSAEAQYRFSASRTKAQLELWSRIEKPWASETVSAGVAFDAIEELVHQDVRASTLYNAFEDRLRAHGLGGVREILSYCGQMGPNVTGEAGASVELVEMVPVIPGEAVSDWRPETKAAIEQGWAHKVITIPFFKAVLVASVPTICLAPTGSIRGTYDTFVHELVHVHRMDPFTSFLLKFELRRYEDVFESDIFGRGGEVDAYRAGIGAEARLLARLGAVNPAAHYPTFQGDDGEVTNEELFRSYVRGIYWTLAEKSGDRAQTIAGAKQLYQFRIESLRDRLRPYLVARGAAANVVAALDAEVARLTSLSEGLQ